MNEVFREEKKFLITIDKIYKYSSRLAEIMKADKHSTGDGYTIRSLYFDSLDDRDFHEKEEGIEIRRKIRLRNYGADTPFAMLEMKKKQGPLQKKTSLKLSREEAQRMIKGDYSVLLTKSEPFAAECYYVMNQFCYRPCTVVTYERKAFVAKENKIRVTFDHHIRGSESSFDIFSHTHNENYILDPYLAVLEVKFNGFLLSYIKDMLNECDASTTSVSKYCLGRSTGKNYHL